MVMGLKGVGHGGDTATAKDTIPGVLIELFFDIDEEVQPFGAPEDWATTLDEALRALLLDVAMSYVFVVIILNLLLVCRDVLRIANEYPLA